MAKSIPAIVKPELLSWARDQAGYTLEEAADKLKIPSDKLKGWESGETISIRQAEKLAKLYQCSYSVFSLQEMPKVMPLATQYRRLPGIKPGNESPELR